MALLFSFIAVTVPVKAANVTVTYFGPYQVVQKTVPQGTDMTYQGPTDVNVPGYAFCGWNVPLANVQTDTIAIALYEAVGTESQSVDVCNTYHNAPTGVLSYSTANADTIPEATRNSGNNPPTLMEKPCTLTATESLAMNPVGIPGQTCVVKWYNGSSGELWKTDVVAYGTSLPQPADPCISGLEFVGWDGSWTNITSDRDIIACYYKTYQVSFRSGITGEALGHKIVRQDNGLDSCTDGISAPFHVGHWEMRHSGDGYNITMYAYPD